LEMKNNFLKNDEKKRRQTRIIITSESK